MYVIPSSVLVRKQLGIDLKDNRMMLAKFVLILFCMNVKLSFWLILSVNHLRIKCSVNKWINVSKKNRVGGQYAMLSEKLHE